MATRGRAPRVDVASYYSIKLNVLVALPFFAVLTIGTSLQLALQVLNDDEREKIHQKCPHLEFLPFDDSGPLAVAASLNGGNVLQRFVEVSNLVRSHM